MNNSIGHGILDGTMIKFNTTENLLEFTTYDRKHGQSQLFSIVKETFSNWLGETSGWEYFTQDKWSFVKVTKSEKDLHLFMTWTYDAGGDAIAGYTQAFHVPWVLVYDLLYGVCETATHLYYEKRGKVKLDFTYANKTMREICAVKHMRRALSKALRVDFRWRHNATVTFYNDFIKHSFYFEEFVGNKRRMNGGLILHESTHRGKSGVWPRLEYNIHT